MSVKLSRISLERFKAYNDKQHLNITDINILLGPNSSGKSSCIQSLLALKQTCESGQERIGLLLNGKYATLGAFSDVLHTSEMDNGDNFSIELGMESGTDEESAESIIIQWCFHRNDKLINGVELEKISISCESVIQVVLQKNGDYEVWIDDVRQPFLVKLDNLYFANVIMEYDREYNNVLAEFIKDTINWISGCEKKVIKIQKDKPVSAQIGRLSFPLDLKRRLRKEINEQTLSEASKVQNHILEMLRRQDSSLGKETILPFLPAILMNNLDFQEFELIWNRYKDKKPNVSNKNYDHGTISLKQFLKTREQDKDGKLLSWDYLDKYNTFLKTVTSNIRYLGPMRELPKSLYQWDIDIDPNYVGVRGEHFPSVLATLENKQIVTILPGESEPEEILFSEALCRWCQYLEVASEIYVDSTYSFGMNIKVHNVHDKKADIMNVGIGTSQVLPVLIMGLISPNDSIIIYEQPELHLHPYSQSRLADFFVAMSKLGKQIIIETHSEYMLHRLRYNLLKGRLTEKQIKLNFFDNKENGTSVYEGKIGKNGEIDYPENFVDQNQSLFFDMLSVKRKK